MEHTESADLGGDVRIQCTIDAVRQYQSDLYWSILSKGWTEGLASVGIFGMHLPRQLAQTFRGIWSLTQAKVNHATDAESRDQPCRVPCAVLWPVTEETSSSSVKASEADPRLKFLVWRLKASESREMLLWSDVPSCDMI